MKLSNIFLSVIFLFFFTAILFADKTFNSQTDVNNTSNWTLTAGETLTFNGNFALPSQKTLPNAVVIQGGGGWRQLAATTSPGAHGMFNLNAGVTNLTINNMTLLLGSQTGDGSGGINHINATSGLTLNGNFNIEQSKTGGYGGGALMVGGGTTTVTGTVKFYRNSALSGGGGAVYSKDNIIFSASSNAEFTGNEAMNGGGAYSYLGSVTFGGGVTFSSNSAKRGHGGGVFAAQNVSFTDASKIINISSNSAQYFGGAIYAGGNVTFAGGADISKNSSAIDNSSTTHHYGGGIYAGGNVLFSSASAMINLIGNIARDSGGAIYSSGTVTFRGSTYIYNNYSETDVGGAIRALGNVSFTNASATTNIHSNYSKSGSGGAIFTDNNITFAGYFEAMNNTAVTGNGGAFSSKGLTISDGATISYNVSGVNGGAVFLNNGVSSFTAITRDILFTENKANGLLNDVHLTTNSVLHLNAAAGRSITFNGGVTYTTTTTGNIVNKNGLGTVNFNGTAQFQTLNVNNGVTLLGSGSSFSAVNAAFNNNFAVNGSTTIIDMRNNNITDNMRISGTLTSNAKIYFDIDSNSNASDKITAGTANMNGTIIKVGIGGIEAAEKTYGIISANTNQGHGTMSIDNTNSQGSYMTRVKSKLTYDGAATAPVNWTNVNLVLSIDQLNVIQGLTDNQKQVALALDKNYGYAVDDLFYIIDVIDKMGTDTHSKKKALIDLSGHIYANAITLPALNVAKDSVFSRLNKSYFIPDDSKLKRNIWFQTHAASNKYVGDKNSPGDFQTSNSGFQAGFDTLKEDAQLFGISMGYVDTNSKQNSDKVDIEGYNLGGYGSIFFQNNFELKVMIMGGKQNYSASRKIKYLNRKTNADFEGYSINTSAELGYDYYYRDNVYLRPFLGADYAYVTTREFTETGYTEAGTPSAADLTVYAGAYNRFNANLGFQVNNGTDMRLKWYGEIKFGFLIAGRHGKFEGEYNNTNEPLDIVGIQNDVFSAGLGGGILYDISKSFSVYANVNGMFAGSQTGYYGNLGVNYKFVTHIVDFYER